ncbi:MAG TPA: sigma 54-interacting transcriptional regulator, partial [Anaeromyxobacteraceae bacterium]|nr:sigma 54-interacting transcriptional regulator [Anaeromyxobacteraceae bacterium]
MPEHAQRLRVLEGGEHAELPEAPVERLYPLIVRSIHEGVFTVDEEFRITSFNPEAERIVGIPAAKAIGARCYEVFRASICQTGCALRETLRTGRPLRDVRIDILDASMRPVPIRVSTAVLEDPSGKLVGGVEIFRDISGIESLHQELQGHRSIENIIGAGKAMQEVLRTLPDIAASDATVLVSGPSGTGKELIARAIHNLSPRREKPFVRVNCGALPDTLLESELFGYVRGAFTDARRDKPGRFTQAHGGTILLDEIGDVSPSFQVKLLRVLQEGEVQPLGSTKTLNVDVRVIAATNRDLAAMVRAGRFREDLYYRIRVVPVALPALRERREDVPLLVDHFVRAMAAKSQKPVFGVSSAALAALVAYDFPGNIRELENVIEHAFVHCHGERIELEHLPPELSSPAAPGAARAEAA